MVYGQRLTCGNRARSRASSFEVVWLDTCICLLRRWIRRYWKMRRGEVCYTSPCYINRLGQELIRTIEAAQASAKAKQG